MKVWIAAAVLVAASFVVAAPQVWPRGGATERPVPGQTAAATQPPRAALHTPVPEPTEASALAHRQTVLQRFACADCHGVDSGWLMPADHAPISEGECRDCHRPAPEPPPITVHDDMEQQPAWGECGLCHRRFAEHPQPAPAAQGLCARCHGAETNEVLPDSHADRSDAASTCIVCHQPRQLEPPLVPHRIEGWEQCAFCHGQQRLTPLAGAHNYEPSADCLSCHDVIDSPGISSEAHALSPEGEACTSCHAPGREAPLAGSHDGRAEVLCVLCHQPAGAGEGRRE